MEKRKKPPVDFTATLGSDRKSKLERIAAANNRSMAQQVRDWIDRAREPKTK